MGLDCRGCRDLEYVLGHGLLLVATLRRQGLLAYCTQARVDLDTADGSGPCEDGSEGYADGGVWVQDSDTVSVTYYDSDLAVVSTDSLTVDTVEPQISNISPVSGTYTRVGNPTISFDVTDTGSGINIQELGKITLTINGVEANRGILPQHRRWSPGNLRSADRRVDQVCRRYG